MRNYKFIVTYDGSKYSGWQRLQDNIEKSIQGKIEILLSKLLEEEIQIIGSGRTDAGVHALMQVCNFKTSKVLGKDFIKDFNRYLPEDIKIIEFSEVDDRFHARYNAKKKIYMYRIDNSPFGNPFIRKFAYHVDKKLDIEKMKEVSKIFIGEHDFTSFSNSKSKKKSSVREIYNIEFKITDDIIEIYFEAEGFLYNMVRMLAGSIIGAGLGQTSGEEVEELLTEKTREKHRFTAPPHGLFLYNVEY
ncbi:MAG: tRNA pseudouridine(38-40) synthase TruA [Fusobacteriaceae bacterium]|nr:tRNA pseudouridine(38-40) synthase TruA [Fusobacteriaceae bacterium]MBU9917141.1 tRNA pseudouridine(38-40) synthase TruA [Fusobacteriaceae bacterium]